MNPYPVSILFTGKVPSSGAQVGWRVLSVLVLVLVGVSFSSAFVLAYLVLPFVAAIYSSTRGGSGYLSTMVPLAEKYLPWLLSLLAWLGMVNEGPLSSKPEELVQLQVVPGPPPTVASSLVRLITGLPNLVLFALAAIFMFFLWLAGLVLVLTSDSLPRSFRKAFAGILRWGTRLLFWQASLVDEYPPFGFDSPSSEEEEAPV